MCGADAYSVRKALILLPSTFFKSSLALSVEKASVVSWFIRSTFHWSLDESSEELDFWPNHPARKRPKESILYRDRGLIKHTWATNMCWSCNLSAIGFISNLELITFVFQLTINYPVCVKLSPHVKQWRQGSFLVEVPGSTINCQLLFYIHCIFMNPNLVVQASKPFIHDSTSPYRVPRSN